MTKEMGYTPSPAEQDAIDDITSELLDVFEGKKRAHVIAAAGDAFLNSLRYLKREIRLAAFDEYTKHARAVLVADLAEDAGNANH